MQGDEVLITWPTYAMYQFYAEIAGAIPRRAPYLLPDLTFPLEELLDSISERTSAILLANPNNPTGRAIGITEIEQILDRAGEAVVLIDEAYFEFYNVTALDLLETHPNLFVSRTFSKVYGMAGFRIGCLLSQAENVAAVAKGQSPYSVNSLAAACSLEAIDDREYINELRHRGARSAASSRSRPFRSRNKALSQRSEFCPGAVRGSVEGCLRPVARAGHPDTRPKPRDSRNSSDHSRKARPG